MSDLTPQQALALVKQKGTELERNMNDLIQTQLNREELLDAANLAAPLIKRIFEDGQEFSEFLSVPLNFPTKRDVANLAQLVIQLEEKLDMIENYLYYLTNQESYPSSIPIPVLPSSPVNAVSKERLSQREQLKAELRLQMNSFSMSDRLQ
ncbi:hypothetical protein GKZ89_18700 [Bacillus mangrovi]|uniref:Uncharacterized protein n=1 Tax=Metabacillus mangrovi TaxID=1491830 RepID=A0A7X2V6E7_9BACI|nr:hypothetical protein [Metabacillus mangrovi]MTH55425.1 hypothetical protein [Metabacillus mangrovi]